jgi:hypothetical protein
MFWIGFTEEPLFKVDPKEEGLVGRIVLGKHKETFVTHLMTWSEQQYIEHWKLALRRVLDGKSAALITDMRTPVQSSHLVWWPMWKIDDDIVFHNQLLFFEARKIKGPDVDVESLYSFVGEHHSHNVEGTPVSEWKVPVSDIEIFLAGGPFVESTATH